MVGCNKLLPATSGFPTRGPFLPSSIRAKLSFSPHGERDDLAFRSGIDEEGGKERSVD